MFILLGFIVTIVTFPGVIIHELGHQLFCRWLGVPIIKVCYFRVGNPAGYVLHEPAKSPWINLLIAIGPLMVNTVLGAIIAFPAVLEAIKLESPDAFDTFLLWLGISIAMHAFPSTGDAKAIWKATMENNQSVLVQCVALPLVLFIYLGAIGSIFWLDAIYGIAVAMITPSILSLILSTIF